MPVYPYRSVWPTVAEDAFIAPTAVLIGDVTVEAGASVWFGAVIRGDVAPIHIGARSNVQDNCVLHADEDIPCEIGADCTLGHGAVVHGATIGEHTLIGMRATVLNSAEVGAECILAAGTVIPEGKRIEFGQLVMGVPGKVVRPITNAERERIYDGVAHYAERAQEYRRMLAEQSQDISL
ncbi:MAG TPA: gamma carbonic anhydrase family protein [Ktedonobacterales bacterium]|jgi:carbonic anhydrase/acetyltransferase-like protein (isoleucine patch superfamily)